MKNYEDNWEQQINDLLDGELSELEAEQLKAAAKDDAALAAKIVDAYQLQQLMAALPEDRAPASLTKRLLAIPDEHKAVKTEPARSWIQPRWAMALAAVPLAIIAISTWQPGDMQPGDMQPGAQQPGTAQTQPPSAAEIAQARHDLAIAFAYLDKAGQITSREIENQVGTTMTDAIAGSVLKNVKSQYDLSKEKNT